MKRIISILMAMVLVGTVCIAPSNAETLVSGTVEMQPINGNEIFPIAYTSDFDAYSNVVGVLNSDGTKTAYIFASSEDAAKWIPLLG